MNIQKVTSVFCSILFIAGTLYANNGPDILVINSDASVDKYRAAQEEFGKSISRPVLNINLRQKKWNPSDIEYLLHDKDPDLIYCIGAEAYLIANRYAAEKEIIFSSVSRRFSFSISRRTYGVSDELHLEMQIMLFRYFFPSVRKIGVLYSKGFAGQRFEKIRDSSLKAGIEIISHEVSEGNAVSALIGMMPDIDAFWMISDPGIMSYGKERLSILKECDTYKVPVFSCCQAFADLGAVLIVSADNQTVGRQAAGMAEDVLSGNRLDNKVQFPAGSHITLNLKKAEAYSLQYSDAALASVNAIIKD